MLSTSDMLAVGALIVAPLIFWAQKALAKRDRADQRSHERALARESQRHSEEMERVRQRDASIERVVSTHCQLVKEAKFGGLRAFTEAGPEQLPDDAAVREAVARIERSTGRSMWGEHSAIVQDVDLREMFLFMKVRRLTVPNTSLPDVLRLMDAATGPRPHTDGW
jgi:hypothetical protein